MSFIYHDRNDDDYSIGYPWMTKDDLEEERRRERERKLDESIRLKHEQILLENFYAGML